MRRRLYPRKLNNLGMSLVEVVVAIAILSIAILPVLSTFIQSARYNARARVRQQTTAAAQTVMENFKAYSIDEIKQQFDAGSFVSGAGHTYMEDPVTGDLTFTITGMRYQNVDYDVRVELSSHKDASGTAQASMGSMDALIYTSRTAENDAIYSAYAGMDALALQGILEEVAAEWSARENTSLPADPDTTPAPDASPTPGGDPASHTAGEVDESKVTITDRVMTFTVSKPSDQYIIQADCKYVYTVNNHPYKDPVGGDSAFSLGPVEYVMDLSGDPEDGIDYAQFFNLETELKSLTLYYYPAYSYVPSGGGTTLAAPVKIGKDTINIHNTCSELGELKCYIYKQKNLALSDNRISTAELANYNVYINLTNAAIYDDNLNMVLGDTSGSKIPDSWIHLSTGAKRYPGIGYEAVYGLSALSEADKASAAGITVSNLRLMYDVEVDVYNSGEMSAPGVQPLNTLTGTIVR